MGFTSFLNRIAGPGAGERLSGLDLHDIGLSKSEMSILRNARPGVRGQYRTMAKIFGIVPEDLEAHRCRTDVALVCSRCPSARACRRFLEGKRQAFTPDDCPNAETYRDLSGEPTAA